MSTRFVDDFVDAEDWSTRDMRKRKTLSHDGFSGQSQNFDRNDDFEETNRKRSKRNEKHRLKRYYIQWKPINVIILGLEA